MKKLNANRVKNLLMNANLILDCEHGYRILADKYKMPHEEVYDKHFTGEIAVIVLSDDAVDAESIYV